MVTDSLRQIAKNCLILKSERKLLEEYYAKDKNEQEKELGLKNLNDSSILEVFAGLAQAEKELYIAGKDSIAIKVYDEIKRRGLDTHHLFIGWAYTYTENEILKPDDTAEEQNIDKEIGSTKYSDHERRLVYSGRICPYCKKAARVIDSAEIYNGKSYGLIYYCKDCKAYAGCHKNTRIALGRLANKELKNAKKRAHHYLDQLWSNPKKRMEIYRWLSEQLGLPEEFTHIGMSDTEQCSKIAELSIERLKEEGKGIIPYGEEIIS